MSTRITTDGTADERTSHTDGSADGGMAAKLAMAWAFVGVPLAYGIYETTKKAAALFTG